MPDGATNVEKSQKPDNSAAGRPDKVGMNISAPVSPSIDPYISCPPEDPPTPPEDPPMPPPGPQRDDTSINQRTPPESIPTEGTPVDPTPGPIDSDPFPGGDAFWLRA